MAIGISTAIGFGKHKSWSQYWTTRYISGLSVITTSLTTQRITATLVGTGFDGVSFERSTDRTNWTVVGTSVNGIYNATGLTGNTFYYWRARLYKGTNYSSYSHLAFQITHNPWFLEGDIPAANCKGAYAPIKATSLAESYINEANPGTNNAVPVIAPTWSAALGWIFDGTQSLNTGIIPANNQSWSMIVKFGGYGMGSDQGFAGVYEGATKQFYLQGRPGINAMVWANGGTRSQQPIRGLDIMSMAGNKGYRDGDTELVSGTIPAGSGNFTMGINIGNVNGSPVSNWFTGNIQAVAIYDVVLTPAQIKAVTDRIFNLSPTETLSYEYTKLGFGADICFSMQTFYQGAPSGDKDPDTFNPTDLVGGMTEWFDTFIGAGMRYAVLPVKAEDGFCLWPTNYADPLHDPYSIAQTAWYAANNNMDITATFVRMCKERGLKPILYYSILDKTHEARTGTDETTDAASYIAMIDAQLTELLNSYSDITAIWFDDWNWHVSYDNIPFEGRYSLIKGIQPNCLVFTNELIHPHTHGDLGIYEVANAGHVTASNMEQVEEIQSIRTDGWWLYDPAKDQDAILSAVEIAGFVSTANSRNACYDLGITPDRTGHLVAQQKAVLDAL